MKVIGRELKSTLTDKEGGMGMFPLSEGDNRVRGSEEFHDSTPTAIHLDKVTRSVLQGVLQTDRKKKTNDATLILKRLLQTRVE